MAHIFLDESGDLGFKKGSSKWFIFTIVLTEDHRRIEKVIKKVHRGLSKKYKRVSELHAYHADEATRKKVLKLLAKEDLKVLCIVLNKDKVYVDLRGQKNYLYNYTANILLDRLHNNGLIGITEPIHLYIDQKDTKRALRDNFEKYLQESFIKRRRDGVNIQIKPSHTEKCLQAVDFVSWAIFRKYEQEDRGYYELIKDVIVEENQLFP
ncbi:MAG: hypothetical protein UY31_C0034G0002 [Candidatus Wolfebacteria bacterium GW2011_GWE1_48_7]|uniref:DUF3800 domain-containing protein n=2 Tax=Candidatus Wolfeibacteriota TaxID=1752735 RepID=A0A0G1U4I6_9BACT|nr:MAG: hypothetical protein UX70_C0001G0069 [Candidatus Wolfebacteria bacterium GW2011_GWB1_47_1]KKU36562.1 MAG: hypothetical protein UX49_C0013G0004 [Candidatus Wolfebacteria bacterium GW2011_GWC2_46_275]KKU41696.1 MAG: hypothetical protein UX58_C0006G0005 [Candidatus Wolfebacteria bacterium GW2011_GWB2_46_69]KKU54010.1 MAG: hypothetical protein UX76_C0007G0069 [Candidatus Wolfebacteria bacterium GW2011_GWC1_47_103]KKU58988.1 MAG: hypothetical protein UX83_C0009G0004 [Candidatus Wolfebacteria